MAKILIIEDDEKLREQISEVLSRQKYEVEVVTDFRLVEESFTEYNPDLVVLDINLPYFDGNYYCRIFRRYSKVPIVVTSARNSDSDQILSMELGADEYVVKPFSVQIFLAKVNAILRRTMGEYAPLKDSGKLELDGIELDGSGLKLRYGSEVRELTKNEYKLLRRLMAAPGDVVSREELLEELWDDVSFVDDNTLTVNVTRVKKLLSEFFTQELIKTKRGAGYYWDTSITSTKH